MIAAALARLPLDVRGEVLDAGVGTGRSLGWLGQYGSVHGIDVNPEAFAWVAARGHRNVRTATRNHLPYEEDRFGFVTCLDVLEHVPDDVGALLEMRRVIRRKGFLVLTVPAHQALFSPHDEAAGHVHRYSMRQLDTLASATGWRTVEKTYFNTILFPAAIARRVWTKRRRRNGPARSDLLATPAPLDPLLSLPMTLEAALVRRGVRLPFGLSILLVLQRP